MADRYDNAVVLRLISMSGWSEAQAITLIEEKNQKSVLFEKKFSSDGTIRKVASPLIQEIKVISNLMAEMMQSLPWRERKTEVAGDDEHIILFEYYSGKDQGYALVKFSSLSHPLKETWNELSSLVLRYYKE